MLTECGAALICHCCLQLIYPSSCRDSSHCPSQRASPWVSSQCLAHRCFSVLEVRPAKRSWLSDAPLTYSGPVGHPLVLSKGWGLLMGQLIGGKSTQLDQPQGLCRPCKEEGEAAIRVARKSYAGSVGGCSVWGIRPVRLPLKTKPGL